MKKIETYIVEKFKISKDIKNNDLSYNCNVFISTIKKKDEKAAEIVENIFKDFNINSFTLYFPEVKHRLNFKKEFCTLNNTTSKDLFDTPNINDICIVLDRNKFTNLKHDIFNGKDFKSIFEYSNYSNTTPHDSIVIIYYDKENKVKGFYLEAYLYIVLVVKKD